MRDEYQEAWLREHRWKVVGATTAVLGLVAMFGIRWAKDKQIEDDRKMFEQLEYEIRHLPPPAPVMPEDPPAEPPAPPLRFEMVAGTLGVDLADGGGMLHAGEKVVMVRELPEAGFAGAGLSFRHGREVSVSQQPDRSVVAVIDGACLVLAPLERGQEVAAPGFPGTGAAAGPPEPLKRSIAGSERDGLLHRRSSGALLETFELDLGKRRLGVVLYRDGAERAIAPLEAILDTLAEGEGGRPASGFEMRIGDKPARQVALDAPVSLGGGRANRVIVRRRSTIRRSVGALTFEHPWSLAVSPVAADAVSSVAVLRGRAVAIRLIALPMAMGVGAARSSLLGSAEVRAEEGVVEASFGDDEVRGKRYAITSEPGDLRAELFVLRRGGKHIGAAVFYREAEQGDALALSDPVLTSVR